MPFREYDDVVQHDNRLGEVDSEVDVTTAEHASAARISDHLGPDTATGVAPAGTMRAGEAGSMPDAASEEWTIEVGADVIGTCGHKVGEVVAVRSDVVVVEKGFFMPTDFYIPKSAIQRNNDHGLYLNVTKNEALHRGWDIDPQLAQAS